MKYDTTSRAFFEEKYHIDADPWHFASSRYEQERYAAIFTALDSRRYERAFEPGCSIGILTARLAAMCDQVVAMDISPTAVSLAKERCKDLPNVKISCGELPAQLPAGSCDLIVFSEIGYYFAEEQLFAILTTLMSRVRSAGILIAAHWLGVSQDHRISGDLVHDVIGRVPELSHQYGERHAGFRLDRWSHT